MSHVRVRMKSATVGLYAALLADDVVIQFHNDDPIVGKAAALGCSEGIGMHAPNRGGQGAGQKKHGVCYLGISAAPAPEIATSANNVVLGKRSG
jgi:hypothetical protein